MKRYTFLILISLALFNFTNCKAQEKNLEKFIPQGYKLFEKTTGDLNKDGIADIVLIIKRIDAKNIITNEYDKVVDRNRRGIIILLNKKNRYVPILINYDCFSSENENGGIYFPPELIVYIRKEKLYIHYAHGRYGYWKYTFRYQNNDFELIGYDESSNHGPVVNKTTSINFLTKKKQEKENTNHDADSGEEVFKETWSKVKIVKLFKLSEIENFDELVLFK